MHPRARPALFHPVVSHRPALAGAVTSDALADCVEACFDCAQTCISCAEASLDEEGASALGHCIQLTLDCANACAATGPALSRSAHASPALIRHLVETCAELCRACADECDRHADEYQQCHVAAEACRACEQSCAKVAMLATGAAASHTAARF